MWWFLSLSESAPSSESHIHVYPVDSPQGAAESGNAEPWEVKLAKLLETEVTVANVKEYNWKGRDSIAMDFIYKLDRAVA